MKVSDIQRFCMHDGNGLRTVVFLKGCPLSCVWCHNPETQSKASQIMFTSKKCIMCGGCVEVCKNGVQAISPRTLDYQKCIGCGECAEVCPTKALTLSGKEMTVEEIIDTVKRDTVFYGSEGGMTVSGGEPTMHGEELIELLKCAKAQGISTCIETCGVFQKSLVEKLLPVTDMFLFDIKDTDSERLRQNTNASLSVILDNLYAIDAGGGKTVLRCIMIPAVNMNDTHASALADIFGRLKNSLYIELLPYHPYGASKAEQLGQSTVTFSVPEKADILAFADKLCKSNVPVKCYGSILQLAL